MTVHCVELVAADDVHVENVRNKVSDLKSSYGEKLPKQASPFEEVSSVDGSLTYFRGSFRVTLTDKASEKTDLLDQVTKEMDKSASWWQARWHECDHDGDTLTYTVEKEVTYTDPETGETVTDTRTVEKTGCRWDTVEWAGTVPAEVQF